MGNPSNAISMTQITIPAKRIDFSLPFLSIRERSDRPRAAEHGSHSSSWPTGVEVPAENEFKPLVELGLRARGPRHADFLGAANATHGIVEPVSLECFGAAQKWQRSRKMNLQIGPELREYASC
jgi:hypothetical protein